MTHGPAHDDDAHAHDAHHDEPPPPEEPATPLWFTVLGAALFVVMGAIFLVETREPKESGGAEAPGSAKPAETAKAPAVIPSPPPGGSAKFPVMTPELLERIRKARGGN